MIFSSIEYAIFLSVVLLLGLGRSGVAVVYLLLGASTFFYGWWNPYYLFLLAAIIVLTWGGAILIDRRRSLVGLFVTLGCILSFLVYFKYTPLFVNTLNDIGSLWGVRPSIGFLDIILPVGISFMTFQAMGYLIDVYNRKVEVNRSFPEVALFISFFPQLVAGPIERAGHLMPQLKRLKEGAWHFSNIEKGVFLILKGMFFKIVIADNLSIPVDRIFASIASSSPSEVAFAIYAFSIQIYCDFYGYTMMALGSATLLGVELRNNFLHPYFATNIRDFWRKWHVTLSQWFRDYVYIPLGGNKGSRVRTLANLFILMVLVGLWHGASFTFVVWGIIHGVMLGAHRGWLWAKEKFIAARPAPRKSDAWLAGLWAVAGWFLTFNLITLAWIPFRSPDFRTAWEVLLKGGEGILSGGVFNHTSYDAPFHHLIIIIFVVAAALDRWLDLEALYAKFRPAYKFVVVFSFLLVTYLSPIRDVQFIYFQF